MKKKSAKYAKNNKNIEITSSGQKTKNVKESASKISLTPMLTKEPPKGKIQEFKKNNPKVATKLTKDKGKQKSGSKTKSHASTDTNRTEVLLIATKKKEDGEEKQTKKSKKSKKPKSSEKSASSESSESKWEFKTTLEYEPDKAPRAASHAEAETIINEWIKTTYPNVSCKEIKPLWGEKLTSGIRSKGKEDGLLTSGLVIGTIWTGSDSEKTIQISQRVDYDPTKSLHINFDVIEKPAPAKSPQTGKRSDSVTTGTGAMTHYFIPFDEQGVEDGNIYKMQYFIDATIAHRNTMPLDIAQKIVAYDRMVKEANKGGLAADPSVKKWWNGLKIGESASDRDQIIQHALEIYGNSITKQMNSCGFIAESKKSVKTVDEKPTQTSAPVPSRRK